LRFSLHTHKDGSTVQNNNQLFEYTLQIHRIIPLGLIFLLVISLVLIFLVNLTFLIKLFIVFALFIYVHLFWVRMNNKNNQRLSYANGKWFFIQKDKTLHEYQLEKISLIFNLGYALNLKSVTTSDTLHILLWKVYMSDEFRRFCKQIHRHGLGNTK